MDILFVNLPPWVQDSPHIGIGYLCSYLRHKKLKPEVLDLNKRFFINHPEFKLLWHVENKNFWSDKDTFPLMLEIFKQDIDNAIKEIVKLNPRIVGFSVIDPKERLTIELINRIKQKLHDVRIILGGPATSAKVHRQIFLDSVSDSVEAFVVGEGEETCVEIVSRINAGMPLHNIPGTLVRYNKEWCYAFLKPIKPLKEIPFPTYEEFDLSLYSKSLFVEWSRGCINKCSFCKNWKLFPFYRAKDPKQVVDELKYHNQVYGIDEFIVVDSVLNGSLRQLYKICSLIIENNLKIRWAGQIAPRKDIDYDFFRHMKKAGCTELQIGVESGSNKVLRDMQKNYTAEISTYTLQNVKKAGIRTGIFIITGFPSEDEKEFEKTYTFIKENKKYIDIIRSINTLHLVAGTEIYENAYERFNIKILPKEHQNYLWETYDGNNYHVRKQRTQVLVDLARDLKIRVIETNIREGKENTIKTIAKKENLNRQIAALKQSVDNLQKLPGRSLIQNIKRFFACYNEYGINKAIRKTIKYLIG